MVHDAKYALGILVIAMVNSTYHAVLLVCKECVA